jgi:hypothetical protein
MACICQAVGQGRTAELPDTRHLLAWRYQSLQHLDMDLARSNTCRDVASTSYNNPRQLSEKGHVGHEHGVAMIDSRMVL